MKKTKLLILLGAAPTVKPGHKHLKPICKEKAQSNWYLRQPLPNGVHCFLNRKTTRATPQNLKKVNRLVSSYSPARDTPRYPKISGRYSIIRRFKNTGLDVACIPIRGNPRFFIIAFDDDSSRPTPAPHPLQWLR